MTSVPLVGDRPVERASARPSTLAGVVVSVASALAVGGVAFALWLSPPYFDGALDRAASATYLGVSPAEAHALSWSVVRELFLGPGTFAQTISGPEGQAVRAFSDTEASHFRDVQVWVRVLSAGILGAFAIVVTGAARAGGAPWFWRSVSRGAGGLAVGLLVVGLFFAVAFEPAFTLFHLIFFSGGNWSFDPRVANMVRLYNTAFWEEVVLVYALLAMALAVIAWAFARARARRLA